MFRRLLNAIGYRAKLLATLPIRRRLGRQVRALDGGGFALISNNCLAGQLYEMARLRKATPTAGIYFLGNSFARFLDDLADDETATWAHIEPAQLGVHESQQCPILWTDDGAGIVFLHYPDPTVASRKWNNRFRRLAGRKLVVITSLRDGLDQSMLGRAVRQYQHIFIAGPAPAPPADEFVLDRKWLKQLSFFLDNIQPAAQP